MQKKRTENRFSLEAPPRFELGSRGFAVRCLTTWLWRRIAARATGYKPPPFGTVLPPLAQSLLFEKNYRFFRKGIEGKYLLAITEDGAGDEIRTRYLHLGKVALCQMSYARIFDCPIG